MNNDKYLVEASSNLLKFEFYSEGIRGKVKKQVVFKKFENQPSVYNLGFGDVEENGEINDIIVTDNGDSFKVLSTVAYIVTCFLDRYPDKYVFATGSTKSRTRLYRIGLANNLNLIQPFFDVYGLLNNKWELFEGSKAYDAFLVKRKKRKFETR